MIIMDSNHGNNLEITKWGLRYDFVILVSIENIFEPRLWLENDIENKTTAALVTFYPELNMKEPISDLIFLIDCSGSMSGSRIVAATKTITKLLSIIPEYCYINICKFGSDYKMMSDTSLLYKSYQTKHLAKKFTQNISANMGGTVLLNALEYILKSQALYPRQLFIITDGEVDNSEGVISTVKINKGSTRVFTFGIGNECAKLVTSVARVGCGKSLIINDKDLTSLEEKVVDQLKFALTPAFIDISTDWGKIELLEQSPYHIPSLYSGDRVLLYALIKPTDQNNEVKLIAKFNNEEVVFPVNINQMEITQGKIIHSLFARQMIRDLEDGYSYFHEKSGHFRSEFLKKSGKISSEEFIKEKIEDLGVRYNLVSKYTSFVAEGLDRDDSGPQGTMKFVENN